MDSEIYTHEPPEIGEESLALLMKPRYEPLVNLPVESPKSCLMARFNSNISGSDLFQCVNHSLEEQTNPNGVNLVLDIRSSNLNYMPARNLFEMAEGLEFWLEQKGYRKTKLAIITTCGDDFSEEADVGRLSYTLLEDVQIYSHTEDAIEWLESITK